MSDGITTVVVEPAASQDAPEVTRKALEHRIRQQEILSELGVIALQGSSFNDLLEKAVHLTAEGLNVQFCKILRHIPEANRLQVVAGVGWDKGIVGVATVGADLASPAGFALRTGKPVISNHLENEERFRTPELLAQHGIRRAMNVILQGDGKPFGVLEVDSKSDGDFVEHDLAFLQGSANVLGMAIERERNERHLKAALARQQFLVKEMNHRVKNSLAIVASLIQLQGRNGNSETAYQFEETARRVRAIARAHERLYRNNHIESMDLGEYIEEVCEDIDSTVPHCKVQVEAQRGIDIKVDDAISIALIIVELVTNAAKYAYPDGTGGKIWVIVQREPDKPDKSDKNVLISVRDDGVGFSENFDPLKSRGLGMRIIQAFAKQLHTTPSFNNRATGSEVKFLYPMGAG